jgi:hypothetical protein
MQNHPTLGMSAPAYSSKQQLLLSQLQSAQQVLY